MHRTNTTPKSWNVNPAKTQTVFANQKSRNAYKAGGEGAASLVFMPGVAHEDHREFVNVAFAAADSFGVKPDYEVPVARIVPQYSNGLPTGIETEFIDHYGQQMQEYSDMIDELGYSETMKRIKTGTANIVNSATIDSTKSLNILDRVLGLQSRSYMLEFTVTKIPSPNLTFTVDTYAEGAVQAKVPELEIPDLQSHSESRGTQTLYKNVGHIAESEEAAMKASHNTMQLREDWTIRDLGRLTNSQIATVLESAADIAGADWGAKTSGYSTNNPSDDIQAATTVIEGNGFDVDYICGHTKVAQEFATNTWVKGQGTQRAAIEGAPSAILKGQKVFDVPSFATVIADQAKTNTIATVGSRDAVWLGVGPTVIANYENVVGGYRGKVIKQWIFPFLAQSGGIRDLTGVTA